MAVTNEDLTIKINAETAEAIKSVKNLDDVFGGLGGQILKANAAVQLAVTGYQLLKTSIEKVVEPFKDAINASIEYQSTLGRLSNTLKITGQYSEESINSFVNFSEAMEQNTTLTQEQAYTMLALAKAVGVTDKQAMQMVQTAKDLSSVTGKDVNDSFHALLSSLKGNSRELTILDPTLKNLGTSAFMSGAAIDQLAKKYAGFGEAAAGSFKGVIAQSKNFKEEIYRNIGDVLMVAFDVKHTEEFKRQMYKNVLETIVAIKPNLIAMAESLRDIKRLIVDDLVGAVRSLGEVFSGLYRAISVLNFQAVALSVAGLTVALSGLFVAIKADAIIGFATNIATLVTTMKAFAVAAWATVAPVALLALKLAAIGVAVLGVVAAVDFLVKNGIKILIGSLEWVIAKITITIGKFMQLIGLAKSGGDKIVAAGQNLDDKSSQQFASIEMGDTTKSVIGKLKEMKAAYFGVGLEAEKASLSSEKIKDAFKDRKVVDQTALEAYTKALDEINLKTKEINLEANKDGMTKIQFLESQLEAQEELIDAKIKEINISKQFSDENKKNLIAALNAQRGAVQKKALSDADKAPGEEYDTIKIAGAELMSNITKGFQTGSAGMITGFLSVADGFLDAAQGVVNFLPNFLDKIANLFNSIVELPLKIVASIGKIFDSILNLIANFIPNILKMVPQLMKTIIKFLAEGLPEAFNSLFEAIPQILTEIVDAIPEFVSSFVSNLISALPRIVISLINSLVTNGPKIAISIVKALVIELPKAILKGLVEAFKNIQNLFFGSIKPKIEMPDVSKFMDDAKKLTGSSSEIFNVKDLTNKLADETKKQAEDLGKAVKDGMQWAIEALVKAWRWIYEKIILPIGNFFKQVFDGIANLLKPIFDPLAKAFKDAAKVFNDAVGRFHEFIKPFADAVDRLMNWKPTGKGGGDGWIAEAGGAISSGWKTMMGYSSGGPVYASQGMLMQPRGTDTIPAMLAPGEFVISAGAAKSLGMDTLRKLNSGSMPSGSSVINNEFKINIEAKGNIDESFVRNKLMSVIKEELRRASLDGERVVSSGGIR